MGATSPGRWHVWQFFCSTGKTSLLKVTALESAVAAAATEQLAQTSAIADANLYRNICSYDTESSALPFTALVWEAVNRAPGTGIQNPLPRDARRRKACSPRTRNGTRKSRCALLNRIPYRSHPPLRNLPRDRKS